MPHPCGACDGTGECQNDHHDFIGGIIDVTSGGVASSECPACGESQAIKGKCSVCGGSGEQDDD
jgi:DnaJ-class molecular chaperone